MELSAGIDQRARLALSVLHRMTDSSMSKKKPNNCRYNVKTFETTIKIFTLCKQVQLSLSYQVKKISLCVCKLIRACRPRTVNSTGLSAIT